MTLHSSQVRQLAEVFPAWKVAAKAIFPEAFKWEKLSTQVISIKVYPFTGDEFGIDVYHGVVKIGTWRPGKAEYQEFTKDEFVYRIHWASKSDTISVYRCQE